jgi:integrase
MAKSTGSRRRRKSDKPAKPHPDFPLFPHATKRWAKKVGGKFWYFGSWADGPQKALERWNAEKDTILAGQDPRTPKPEGLTVKGLANKFLNHKQLKMKQGELTARSFADHHAACRRVLATLGANHLAVTVGPDEFAKIEAGFPATWGPKRRGREIVAIRTLFHFGEQNEKDFPRVRFGQFKPASKDVLRRARAVREAAHGLRTFTAGQLKQLLAAADVRMRALILCGINAAYGNGDLSSLPMGTVDLEGGWISFARPKTGVARKCKLWAETVAAIRAYLAERPEPIDPADADLLFLSPRRSRLSRVSLLTNGDGETTASPVDYTTKAFRRLLRDTGLERPGLSFYSLRHSFRTVADESGDLPAINLVMGHSDSSMGANYRAGIADARLERVATHVRDWLFGNASKE